MFISFNLCTENFIYAMLIFSNFLLTADPPLQMLLQVVSGLECLRAIDAGDGRLEVSLLNMGHKGCSVPQLYYLRTRFTLQDYSVSSLLSLDILLNLLLVLIV